MAAIVHQPVGFDLRRGQVLGDVDGHLAEAQFLRRKPPGVAANYYAVFIDDDALPKPELLD
jgi:hypothetical protein